MTTRDTLIETALAVVSERGYRGATTKVIAEAAGVSEMTLFRHFPAKAELVTAALQRATEPFRAGAAQSSDDVTADLVRLCAGYAAFVDTHPALVDRVLPEIATDDDLGPIAEALMAGNAEAVRRVITHHLEAGRLADRPADDLVRQLLGPLLARAALRRVLTVEPFDADRHVADFLHGVAGSSPGVEDDRDRQEPTP